MQWQAMLFLQDLEQEVIKVNARLPGYYDGGSLHLKNVDGLKSVASNQRRID